jgi:hypothetical protein
MNAERQTLYSTGRPTLQILRSSSGGAHILQRRNLFVALLMVALVYQAGLPRYDRIATQGIDILELFCKLCNPSFPLCAECVYAGLQAYAYCTGILTGTTLEIIYHEPAVLLGASDV